MVCDPTYVVIFIFKKLLSIINNNSFSILTLEKENKIMYTINNSCAHSLAG